MNTPSTLKPLRGVRIVSLALNLPGPAALMHVTPHHQRIDADKGNSLLPFIIRICRCCQRGFQIPTCLVGHLLYAKHQSGFNISRRSKHC